MGCYNSVTVNAPAERVWHTLRAFHDMSWAPNVVESCETEGELPETQIGTKRILNGAFHESLTAMDDHARMLRYRMDDGPEALSKDNVVGYIGRVQVFPITENNTSFVVWEASWESSGGGVHEFCNPIYQALLAELKRHFS